MRISQETLEKMFEHCQREYPNEACGYLAGRNGQVMRSFPIRNDASSPTWYEMNPLDQLRTQKAIRESRLEHLAVYHSHVVTEAYPSRRDVERATAIQDFFDGIYLLITLKERGVPSARAFKIRDGHVQEEELVPG